jgi:hypothetical protein
MPPVAFAYRLRRACCCEEKVGCAFLRQVRVCQYPVTQLITIELRHIYIRDNHKGQHIVLPEIIHCPCAVAYQHHLIRVAQAPKYPPIISLSSASSSITMIGPVLFIKPYLKFNCGQATVPDRTI